MASYEGQPDALFGEVQAPTMLTALPRRLGSFPFWRAEEPFLEAIELIYREASATALNAFLSEQCVD